MKIRIFNQWVISTLIFVSVVCSSHASAASNPIIYTRVTTSEQATADILFIPGLMSDASVWQSTAQALAQSERFNFHFIEVAGFAGRPPAEGITLDKITSALLNYIEENELKNTLVIGHSMGAFLAYKLALQSPDSIDKVVGVDGLPFITPIFTRTNSTTAAQARPFAERIAKQYAEFDQAQLANMTRQGITIQASAKSDQQAIIAMAAKSDPVTVGNIMAELMVSDLREQLKNSQTPILFLGASGGFNNTQQHQLALALFQQQFVGVRNASVQVNQGARHFIMFDDLTWLVTQIQAFLTSDTLSTQGQTI